MRTVIRLTSLLLGLAALPTLAQPLYLPKPTDERRGFEPYVLAGPSFGALVPSSEKFAQQANTFAKAGLATQWMFLPTTGMTLEADATFPDGGAGGSVGITQSLLPFVVSPFVGGSLGFRYVGNEDRDGVSGKFADRFGPTIGAQVGVQMFRESPLQVRVRGNYEAIFNEDRDQSVGLDVALLWSFGRPNLPALDMR